MEGLPTVLKIKRISNTVFKHKLKIKKYFRKNSIADLNFCSLNIFENLKVFEFF